MIDEKEPNQNIIKKETENKESKVSAWFKDPYNRIFLGILAITIILRLYYFIITKNQPLWWDEAEYMSTAKSFAGIIDFDYSWTLNRFPGFPFLVSLFYMIGITNEVILKFLVAFIPSIIAIALMYFVVDSMYSDKRISLISTLLFSFLWEHIFFSSRFHTENFSLIFEFLAIIVLFSIYLKKEDFYLIKSKHSLGWIGVLAVLCILFRSGNMIFVPVVILFLLIVNFYKIPQKFRGYGRIGLVVIILASFFLMRFLAKVSSTIGTFYNLRAPLAWNSLNIFNGLYESLVPVIPSILLYAFFLGIIVFALSFIIFPEGTKNIGKHIKNSSYKADIFNIILIIAVLFFFIFIIKSSGEYRWFFALLPGLFAFTAKGLIWVGDYFGKLFKTKYISIILIVLLLCLGLYTQYYHTDLIVKAKLSSYAEVKDSGFWMKDNSNKEDIVISSSLMQHSYYGQMKVYNLNGFSTEENLTDFINLNHPKYLVLSIFEPHPTWAYDYPQKYNETIKPVKVYYDKQNPQQPLLIIYLISTNLSQSSQ